MKVGCIIQGDIRRGSEFVLQELPKLFDFTVLSTWKSDEERVPAGQFSVILNDKPVVAGLSHRNYQRLSTARGVHAAKDAGCDYVLKWRTDMLPTRLDVQQLLQWANFDVPPGMKSRIVMPAFRNLTVEPDWFSSIPDLFSFAHIDVMEMLWGDRDFDYSLQMNLPKMMREFLRNNPHLNENLGEIYCAESELYAIFKDRLQSNFGANISHESICKNYFRLFDDQRLNIFWFDQLSGFRSIKQAWEHPWWTEAIWALGKPDTLPCGYPVKGFVNRLNAATSSGRCYMDELRQRVMWRFARPSRFR